MLRESTGLEYTLTHEIIHDAQSHTARARQGAGREAAGGSRPSIRLARSAREKSEAETAGVAAARR